ncbi:MAG: NfeD family protein [Thermoplasmataceae archaeon]
MAVSNTTFDLTIILVAILFFFIGAWLGRLFVRYPFGHGPYTGKESMVGELAVVKTVKNDEYEISYDSQIWSAIPSEADTFSVDEKVKIIGNKGLKLIISKYDK